MHDKQKGTSFDIAVSGSYNSALSGRDGTYNPLGENRIPDFDFTFGSYDKRQANRATVGDGLIIVRDGAANSLVGLNRDVSRAQETTKDENVYMQVYVPPTLLGNLTDGLDGDLGKAWGYVGTAWGLTLGAIGMGYDVVQGKDPDVSTDYNAYNFYDNLVGWFGDAMGLYGAITFGNTIHYSQYEDQKNSHTEKQSEWIHNYDIADYNGNLDINHIVRLPRHEEQHTYQYQYYGPTFFVKYLLSGPGSPNNPLEKDADRYGKNINSPNWHKK